MLIIKLNPACENKHIFTFGANKSETEVAIHIQLSATPLPLLQLRNRNKVTECSIRATVILRVDLL